MSLEPEERPLTRLRKLAGTALAVEATGAPDRKTLARWIADDPRAPEIAVGRAEAALAAFGRIASAEGSEVATDWLKAQSTAFEGDSPAQYLGRAEQRHELERVAQLAKHRTSPTDEYGLRELDYQLRQLERRTTRIKKPRPKMPTPSRNRRRVPIDE